MHLVLEQRKQWQKQQISIGNTDLFYNSMGAVRKLYHFKIGKIGLEIIEQGQFKREEAKINYLVLNYLLITPADSLRTCT